MLGLTFVKRGAEGVKATTSGLGPISIPNHSCDEKRRLGSEYDAYTARYSRMVKILRQRMGIISKPGYEELLHTAEAARVISEKARLKLEGHIAEHGC
jgi:hypothetical protein